MAWDTENAWRPDWHGRWRSHKPGQALVEQNVARPLLRVRNTGTTERLLPGDANFSRLLRNVVHLEEQQGLVSVMVDTLRARLMEVLPDFGKHLGYDGKAIDSHSTGRTSRKTGKTSDPDADWGKHEICGIDNRTGKTWKKVKSWFGYGVHLIADTGYEIPVAFQMTRASASEPVVLSGALGKLFAGEPELRERCEDFSADRGLDSGPLKQTLWDDHGIRPLIDTIVAEFKLHINGLLVDGDGEMEVIDPSTNLLRCK